MNSHEHRLSGSAVDATDWIAKSDLSIESKRKLMEFVNRFPTLVFYKNDDEVLNKREESENVLFPLWLRQFRKTLAYVFPTERTILFKIDSCDGWSPRQDDIQDYWYSFGLIGFSNDFERKMLDEAGNLFPIGSCDSIDSNLAISLASDSTAIYEYCQEDLEENLSEGTPPIKSVYKIFDNFEDLFKHIVAFKLPNNDVITATLPIVENDKSANDKYNLEIYSKVKKILSELLDVDPAAITFNSKFSDKGINADDLDMIEIIIAFEDEFSISISNEDANNLDTIGEAVEYIDKILQSKNVTK